VTLVLPVAVLMYVHSSREMAVGGRLDSSTGGCLVGEFCSPTADASGPRINLQNHFIPLRARESE